uniref:Pectinesterase n=1 Tax=Kalanchoe fedtschenkoi TaxID=63787 RepID=A0A7N0TIP0_KALFE
MTLNHTLFLLLASALFLTTTTLLVVAGTQEYEPHHDAGKEGSGSHAIIKSSCSNTFHPDLCLSAYSSPQAAALTTQSQVVQAVLNQTRKMVHSSYNNIMKLRSSRLGNRTTKRVKTALDDCVELIQETLEEIEETVLELKTYPSGNALMQHAEHLKTLLSAAMTNQETCLDGFSHDKKDKQVRRGLIDGQLTVRRLCGDALAMITNMTATATPATRGNTEPLLTDEHEEKVQWPEWLSGGDRKLLQSTTVTPNVVVAADGSGDYRTVSEAVEAAPSRSTTRYVIRIKAGVYRENVDVPSAKTNIMFVGDSRLTTIITASRNVVDGSTTFNSATVAAVGAGFLAKEITFENTAGASKHQAVALRVGSDRSAFYRCDMLAYQDTLYVHSNRQFYICCYIAGTVDFIFGNAAAVLQNCDIHARRPNPGQRNMVTAQGRSDPNQNTGIVIQKCRIGATSDLLPVLSSFPTYLGRPWKEYSRTVVMQSNISNVISPAGWYPWSGTFALSTLYYAEYENTGAGADTSQRVTWAGYQGIISATEAASFAPGAFIDGGSWLNATTFPYSLGL